VYASVVTVSVGVRELRSKLREYLDRVANGEEVVVTERGVPVARIVPAKGPTLRERLIAEGVLTPAKRPRRPLPPPVPIKGSVVELLLEERRSERS